MIHTPKTAADEYKAEEREIRLLLSRLDETLFTHRRDFRESGSRDWGYPGDLGHIRARLQEIDEFLNGEDDAGE